MRARLSTELASESFAAEAAAIVRTCVHCGFCNATCPTYQLSGNELEGPRGRIYLIKALLEEGRVGEDTREHLDNCLVCRNCETTCPSGVRYGQLVELVRPRVFERAPPPWSTRLVRRLLLGVVPYRRRFAALLGAGRLVRPLLPAALAAHVPPRVAVPRPVTARGGQHARRVVLLEGCVQPVLNPAIDNAARRVFDALGIEVVRVAGAGCCGALAHHLGAEARAVDQARAVVDACWPHLEDGAEAVMMTASGCGTQLKDYAHLLRAEPAYAERAARLAASARDPLELVDAGVLAAQVDAGGRGPLAVQAPCSLQHGQRLAGRLEGLLRACGFALTAVAESHLCCGSAGSYSLLHPATSQALRARKLGHLMAGRPELVVTANIGCQSHLAAVAEVPVRHWLELVADCLRPAG